MLILHPRSAVVDGRRQEQEMNHFVLHDASDCMAVVVVEGVS